MYDDGKLTNLGSADLVIQGIVQLGYDPDGSDFPMQFEFEPDNLDNPLAD